MRKFVYCDTCGGPKRFFMIFKRVASGRFPMFDDGETRYRPLCIDNPAGTFLLAREPGKGAGEAYLIADEEYLSIEELVRTVGRALHVDVRVIHLPITPLVIAGHVCEGACKPFGIAFGKLFFLSLCRSRIPAVYCAAHYHD